MEGWFANFGMENEVRRFLATALANTETATLIADVCCWRTLTGTRGRFRGEGGETSVLPLLNVSVELTLTIVWFDDIRFADIQKYNSPRISPLVIYVFRETSALTIRLCQRFLVDVGVLPDFNFNLKTPHKMVSFRLSLARYARETQWNGHNATTKTKVAKVKASLCWQT